MMRRLVLLMVTTMLALAVMAGPAFALHCYVADKPNGAGAVTLEDLKVNGAGKLIAPGAFVSTEETGATHDIFIRGQPIDDPFVTGEGLLPSPPHHRGSETHGVQEFDFPGS
jgi:hypothetical protein